MMLEDPPAFRMVPVTFIPFSIGLTALSMYQTDFHFLNSFIFCLCESFCLLLSTNFVETFQSKPSLLSEHPSSLLIPWFTDTIKKMPNVLLVFAQSGNKRVTINELSLFEKELKRIYPRS